MKQVQKQRFSALWIPIGIFLGILLLLFAMVNARWVEVRIPTVPWSPEPYSFAFEARLWGVMATCFFLGAGITVWIVSRLWREQRRKTADPTSQVKRLEAELERLTRLLTLTRDKQR